VKIAFFYFLETKILGFRIKHLHFFNVSVLIVFILIKNQYQGAFLEQFAVILISVSDNLVKSAKWSFIHFHFNV
jgi:hypothetical protein